MRIKAVLIDFDKTITKEDMSDLLADRVGKHEEGERLNELFQEGKLPGLTGLIQRINFLQGMTVEEMRDMVSENDQLRKGAKELFAYFKEKGIISIIASGSIVPFLEIYQEILGVDYLVGSRPKMKDGTLQSISEEDFSGLDFKVRDSKKILDELQISPDELVAIGDSPADLGLFDLAAVSIGVNPHERIRDKVDHVIEEDLSLIIPILEELA